MFKHLSLYFFSVAPLAIYAGQKAPDSYACRAKKNTQEYTPYSKPVTIGVKHIEAKGIGYKEGYSTLEAFFVGNGLGFNPFLDLRGHVFNDGKWAANAGVGFRYLKECRTYGMNLYYDYRNQRHSYQQIGLGFESLGQVWDFRANGYLPVGKKEVFGHFRFDKFSGNHLYIKQKVDYAMAGADAEAGAHFFQNKDFDLYAGAGPYYFAKRDGGKNAIGGKARLTAWYKDYVSLEVSGSGDAVFHGIVQGTLGFYLPLGPKKYSEKCCRYQKQFQYRIARPVDRDEIIVLNHHTKSELAINPATGDPYHFLFVNNTSHSNGTFESPFSTLLTAQNASVPNDVIYVFPGDGTVTGMNAGITLQNSQKFFGSGIVQTLKTTNGTVKIPALSSSLPLITNSSGSAITCANNNEISGVHLLANATVTGITLANITNASIHQNIIDVVGSHSMPPTSVGVSFTECGGQINFVNNVVNQTNFISSGLALLGVAPNSNYLIQHNQFLATVGGGSQGISLGQGITSIGIGDFDTILILGNLFVGQGSTNGTSGHGNAIGGFGFTGTGYLVIDSNTFSHQTNSPLPPLAPLGYGVSVFLVGNTGTNMTMDITNNVWENTVNPTVPFSFIASMGPPFEDTPPINLCIKLQNNSSDTQNGAYAFVNSDSPTYAPFQQSGNTVILDSSNNVGSIFPSGTVTPGTCQ